MQGYSDPKNHIGSAANVQKWLPLKKMLNGYAYEMNSRGSFVGVWFSDSKTFAGYREKFGTDTISMHGHWDDGGCAKPLVCLGRITAKKFGRLGDPAKDVLLIYLKAKEQELRLHLECSELEQLLQSGKPLPKEVWGSSFYWQNRWAEKHRDTMEARKKAAAVPVTTEKRTPHRVHKPRRK